jgi:hypothetical protein
VAGTFPHTNQNKFSKGDSYLKKTTGIALALGAMLIVPGGAWAAPTKADTKAASAECHALRDASPSKEEFRTLYGPFGKCVSTKAKEEAAERRASRRAAREACKEQDLKGKEYRDCVKGTAENKKAKKDAKDEARIEAAEGCTAEQEADADAFAEEYGTKKNAFRKCVKANT